MRIAEVIGTVTLSRQHPLLSGARFRLAVPMTLANLSRASSQRAEAIVVYDDLGSGLGGQIAVSEGVEAAQPFYPADKPIDAYNAALLDKIDLESP